MLKALILFGLVLWLGKSIVDALEYHRVSKLYKDGLGLASGTDHGLEVDLETGESKTTERPVVRV